MDKIHYIDLYKQGHNKTTTIDYTQHACMCGHIRRKITSKIECVTCEVCKKEVKKYYRKIGW
jgi:hypothetical protein